MSTPMIEFKDYSFKYRTQKEPTLKHIDLTIERGEKVLIVGPSGSGKSTLANCLNGLIPFSFEGEVSGSLTIDGKSAADLGIFELSKKVGTVLQDPDGQFIGLTVGEDIAFALENDCVPVDEMHQKVQEAAAIVGVEHLLEHSPQALSGGQKQRVSMAGVMIDAVPVLLFDEPLANLDPATGKYAIELIDQIHQDSDTTIVIIEHRLEDVLWKHVDRIIVVNDGEIQADMTPEELLCTNILTQQGIREPLYISAMKYAGCTLCPENHLEDVHNLVLGDAKEKIQSWFNSIENREHREEKEELLKLEQICFSYEPSSPILRDISFSIQKGEMVSIVGTNGAGKSTLSKLICGFEKPTSGKMYYQGREMSKDSIRERAERIGTVMQNPNQMISKPMIYDEVALGLYARNWEEAKIREQVERTLKICGLYPFRNWPVSALSFGQKKRVTIASILVLNPEIMILDEPTAGQDFKHYTEIMEFIKQINQELNITILMITHDMHLMLEYTDRAIVVSDGQILADSTPAQVITDMELIKKASLKETSLYDLALRCGIQQTDDFVNCFIQYDREVRS